MLTYRYMLQVSNCSLVHLARSIIYKQLHLPGYFPPLFRRIRHTMIRINSSRRIIHISMINQVALATAKIRLSETHSQQTEQITRTTTYSFRNRNTQTYIFIMALIFSYYTNNKSNIINTFICLRLHQLIL